jgi:hypothetical protein
MTGPIRKFSTGATRNADANKLDFEGFLSPLVLRRYAEYMHQHRKLPDGSLRASDNWQQGIPADVYMKSAWRHFFDLWSEHRGIPTPDGIENDACALLFNVSGFLHEYLKSKAAQSTGCNVTNQPASLLSRMPLWAHDYAPSNYDSDGSRIISTPAEIAELSDLLTAEELKGFGIGDVEHTGHSGANVLHDGHPLRHVALPEDRL